MNQPSLDYPDSTPPGFEPPKANQPPTLDEVRRALDRASARFRADLEKLSANPREIPGQADLPPAVDDLIETPPAQPDLPAPGEARAPRQHLNGYPPPQPS